MYAYLKRKRGIDHDPKGGPDFKEIIYNITIFSNILSEVKLFTKVQLNEYYHYMVQICVTHMGFCYHKVSESDRYTITWSKVI